MTKIAQDTDGLRALTDSELDFVIGGASLGGSTVAMSTSTTQAIARSQELEAAYAKTHPFEYYGYFG